MELVKPQVALIAATQIKYADLQRYLDDIGAKEFKLTIDGVEGLTMVAGKACYKSFEPGLNPNIKKVRDDAKEYLENINKVGHGSVQEHGCVTFIFWNVSRVFTHEVVRHRVGTAMSQESLRYVRLDKLKAWIPSCIEDMDPTNGEGLKLFMDTFVYLEMVQAKLAKIYKIDKIKNFTKKKTLTSAFRRVAPIGLSTSIVWSMNMRAARHLIQMRTSRHAEEEIRLVFDEVATILMKEYPLMFSDFRCEVVDKIGEWTSRYAAMPYDNEKINESHK